MKCLYEMSFWFSFVVRDFSSLKSELCIIFIVSVRCKFDAQIFREEIEGSRVGHKAPCRSPAMKALRKTVGCFCLFRHCLLLLLLWLQPKWGICLGTTTIDVGLPDALVGIVNEFRGDWGYGVQGACVGFMLDHTLESPGLSIKKI